MTAAPSPLRRLILVLAATLVVVAASGCTRAPADDSAEAGFARDMATHHAQAVEMAFIVRDATTDPRLRTLAADIIVTQSAQRGMFMAWLQEWGVPQASSGPRMAWMDSSGAGDSASATHHTSAGQTTTGMPHMAGMATDAELERLRRAIGREAEVLFLQLMIRHHEGGVLMARALLALSQHGHVVTLARAIESGQTGEIDTMAGMLKERGAQALESLL